MIGRDRSRMRRSGNLDDADAGAEVGDDQLLDAARLARAAQIPHVLIPQTVAAEQDPPPRASASSTRSRAAHLMRARYATTNSPLMRRSL